MFNFEQVNAGWDNPLRFRLTRIKKIDFFVAEIYDRKNVSKTLNEYITAHDYVDKTACFIRWKQWYFSLPI